jgi:NADPH:quinone reductase-like Zn-dependent oxidoreductase
LKTWSAFGDLGRRPTEYEILTHGMNHTMGDPPLEMGPDVHGNRWLREHRDAVALTVADWDAFRDPDAVNIVPIPDGVSFAQAAALAANGPVARAQLDAGGVAAGSTVLVLGASGALGSAVVALARFRGAEVIATARLQARPDALTGMPVGAQVDTDRPDFAAAVLEITGGWGVDCVIDNLGLPALWNRYQPALAAMGRVVVSGALDEVPVPVALRPLYLRNQSIIGVRTGNRSDIARLWQDVQAGFRLVPDLLSTMPLAAAAAAHQMVEAGRHRGQIILTPPDSSDSVARQKGSP